MLMKFPRSGIVALVIYTLTALCCWLTPSRFSVGEERAVINIYPTQAFALAAGALAVMHAALRLHGRLVVAVAACWAVATTMTVTSFAILRGVAPSTWSKVEVAQAVTLAFSACALSVLAWQIVRRRLAPGAHLTTRGLAGLGLVLLALY